MGEKPKLALGTYRHYKGDIYEVIGLACHSETLEWHVIYESHERKSQGLPAIWVRPYKMFVETITQNEESVPRFKKIETTISEI
jgi:hypothetical protein